MSVRTMNIVMLVRPGRYEIRTVPVPDPGPGEVVLRVETALTCGTDLKTFRRGHPRIPTPVPMGHEASGTVVSTGPGVSSIREGDAIACVPTVACGACRLCRRGRENLCPHGVDRMNFGAFADFLRLPAHITGGAAFLRPPGMDADEAAGLEPLACVVHGANRVNLARAEHVVIIGDGPIALLFVQVARLRGHARILVAGHHEDRLALATRLGADATTTSDGDALKETVAEFTNGFMADVVVECVGLRETWRDAVPLAARAGTVLLFGGLAAGAHIGVDAYRLHYEEVDLIGAFHYGRADVREALSLLAGGDVRIAPLITHRMPLDRFGDALDLALGRRAIKVAIEPVPSA